MVIKDTGIGGKEAHLGELDHIMDELGFVRWAWDYNHATYDYKLDDKGTVFYLRVQANAVQGKLEDPETLLRLDDPFMGKQTFPHGLDYDFPMPTQIVESAKRKITSLKEKLSNH